MFNNKHFLHLIAITMLITIATTLGEKFLSKKDPQRDPCSSFSLICINFSLILLYYVFIILPMELKEQQDYYNEYYRKYYRDHCEDCHTDYCSECQNDEDSTDEHDNYHSEEYDSEDSVINYGVEELEMSSRNPC